MLKAYSKRMVDSHCTRKKAKYEIGNFLLLLCVCKKSETFLEFKFRIIVTVMKGPYLPITRKRKTIFFSMTKNNKKMYILKKESNHFLNIPIS